jgi:hypothetical protein
LVRGMAASLVEGRLSRKTVAITGPETITLKEAARRVAEALGRRPLFVHVPVFIHYILGWIFERLMTIPLASLAQVRILSEGIVDPLPECESLPDDLLPRTKFDSQQIQRGLPKSARFGIKDLRWFA